MIFILGNGFTPHHTTPHHTAPSLTGSTRRLLYLSTRRYSSTSEPAHIFCPLFSTYYIVYFPLLFFSSFLFSSYFSPLLSFFPFLLSLSLSFFLSFSPSFLSFFLPLFPSFYLFTFYLFLPSFLYRRERRDKIGKGISIKRILERGGLVGILLKR